MRSANLHEIIALSGTMATVSGTIMAIVGVSVPSDPGHRLMPLRKSQERMNYIDYYKVLGVSPTATTDAIKKAFRKLAVKYHPDKTRGDKAAGVKFVEINDANQVLGDPEKRKKYDQFGADWKRYEETGAQQGGFDWSKYAGEGGSRKATDERR